MVEGVEGVGVEIGGLRRASIGGRRNGGGRRGRRGVVGAIGGRGNEKGIADGIIEIVIGRGIGIVTGEDRLESSL